MHVYSINVIQFVADAPSLRVVKFMLLELNEILGRWSSSDDGVADNS